VEPAAEEAVLAGTVGDELGEALRRLAPELRAVLQATVLDGLTVREAAVLLGVPEGTVKTRARRARIALREALS
jgi:RNA polymerase sigma-70 factor (ECF subfamily)